MTKEWEDWFKEAVAIGSSPFDIRDKLLENSFSLEQARDLMGDKFRMDHFDSASKKHFFLPPDMYKALTNIRITKPAPNLERIDTDLAQVYVLDKFMSEKECELFCNIARAKLRRSTVAGQEGVQYIRTSSTCPLNAKDDGLVKEIDRRISEVMGLNHTYTHNIEAQLYTVGQEFKPHTDTFPPFTPMYEKYVGNSGNRTWTFMVYLQRAVKGGGTWFPKLDRVFSPPRGTAIIWNNLDEHGIPNDDTLHAGLPVEEGEKMVITKWFRERGTGLMFLDPLLG